MNLEAVFSARILPGHIEWARRPSKTIVTHTLILCFVEVLEAVLPVSEMFDNDRSRFDTISPRFIFMLTNRDGLQNGCFDIVESS